MRMIMKRGASLLLALALLVGLLPTSVYATESEASNVSAQESLVGETQGVYEDEGVDTTTSESTTITGGNEKDNATYPRENEELEPDENSGGGAQ